MPEKATKPYNQAVDVLRIIAIGAVLLIHTTTRTLEKTGNDLVHTPWTLFLNQAARFAVPMFFMISGFVLELSYTGQTNYLTYLKKRLSKIFIPYVFWSAVYYFFIYKEHSIGYFPALLTGNASYQLYFIPTLLIFYLIFPLIHIGYRLLANKWVMIAAGGIQVYLLYYSYFVRPLPVVYPIAIALLNYYVFMLGIVAARHQDKILALVGKYKLIAAAMAIGAAGYVYVEGKTGYLQTHNYLMFYSQWRPSVLVYTMALAGGLFYLFSKHPINRRITKKLAGLSFFVFFCHVIILEKIWTWWGEKIFQTGGIRIAEQVWYDPVFFAAVAGGSFVMAYIVHKIPYLAKIVG